MMKDRESTICRDRFILMLLSLQAFMALARHLQHAKIQDDTDRLDKLGGHR
jgi:hypothetical protein